MAAQLETFEGYLKHNQELIKKQIQVALPRHMNADRMMRVLTTEIKRVPELKECTTQSILGALMQASQLGLEIGSLIGHGYLVPFKRMDKKTNKYVKECQFIIGYRGMIDLARRSGKIISISAHEVYENDHFEFQYGLDEKLNHIPAQGERGHFIAAYAVAKLDNGGYSFGVMFKNEIDKIRSQSKTGSKEYSPWGTHYEEMAKKTVIRRLFKYLPVSIELYENLIKEEISEITDITDTALINNNIVLPGEITQQETKSQALANKMESNKEELTEELSREYFNEN